MKNDIKVSIIIPAYNVEKFLPNSLKSLSTQTYKNLEIIVVDDASTDNSKQIAIDFSRLDKRIKVISNATNKGAMYARHKGCENATGEYITFLDCDDSISENAIELLLEAALKNEADLVIGNNDIVLENGTFVKRTDYKLSFSGGGYLQGIYRSLLNREIGHNIWGKLYSKKLFEYKYDIFENMSYGEDTALFYQLIKNVKKAVIVEDVVYHYYQISESACHRKQTYSMMEQRAKASKYIEKVGIEYPSMRKEMVKYMSTRVKSFFEYDVCKKDLIKALREYDIYKYINPFYLIKYLPFKRVLKIIRWRIKIKKR